MPDTDFDYRQTIHDAWIFTRENKKLMLWFSFLPSLLTTLVGIFYLAYQFMAFKRSPLFENAEQSFLHEFINLLVNFFKDHESLLIPAVIATAIVVVFYLLLPTFCQGGLIQIIARKRKGEKVRTIEGISFGLLAFLPLFEYHLLIKGFSLFGVLTETGFAIRNLGPNSIKLLLPIFGIIAIIGIVLALLFTYTEFFIVIERKKVLQSMGKSCALVILSWQHTFLLGILMLIIGLRVILNLVAILLVPALIIFSAGFLATITLAKIGIAIGIVIGVVALIFAAYFNGILNMFANTVWTFTFLELRKQKRTQEMLE